MKALLSCGGTGGHIYPAIAIADKIKERFPDAEILFIGTKKGMENRLVPAAGYEIRGIDASGINRKNPLANIKTFENVIKGSHEAWEILKSFAPDVAIGTGGYVTGSVIFEAKRLGIPCFIHEQNAFPGLTNRLLERLAAGVFISFEESRHKFAHPDKCIFSGNPVRADFSSLDRASCRVGAGVMPQEKMVLIFGGSLGAGLINDAALEFKDAAEKGLCRLFFITGKRYFDAVSALCGEKHEGIELIPYADNMPQLMTAADLVVSRAGAIAVSEIMVCGKPSVLIPSPNVTNNHQYFNAKAIADAGACLMLEEKELSKDIGLLEKTCFELLNDPDRMYEMGKNAEALGCTDACDIILDNILKYMKK